MFDLRFMIVDVRKSLRRRRARGVSRFPNRSPNANRGISLVEILISMFVLLFGLMGVASIFPVGNHYMTEGEQHDMGSTLSQNAFEELGARGMLRPQHWLYAGNPPAAEAVDPSVPTPEHPPETPLFIQDGNGADPGLFNVVINPADPTVHPGHAFVIDPMSVANAASADMLDEWPQTFDSNLDPIRRPNPWNNNDNPDYPTSAPQLAGRWPLRRMTLPVPDSDGKAPLYSFLPMQKPVAETIFNLRDDLVVEFPEEDDLPSIQTWDIDSKGTATVNDDTLLRRQYQGNYSWLATVVPQTQQAWAALQPADLNSAYSNYRYDVSVVIFRKRDSEPSKESERLITAKLESDGNLVIYSQDDQEVEDATKEIRPSNWIALAGVNQVTGVFMLKWYRILAIDSIDPDSPLPRENLVIDIDGTKQIHYVRRAMLDGPRWPSHSHFDIQAVILPGAIGAITQELTMEGGSLRSYE